MGFLVHSSFEGFGSHIFLLLQAFIDAFLWGEIAFTVPDFFLWIPSFVKHAVCDKETSVVACSFSFLAECLISMYFRFFDGRRIAWVFPGPITPFLNDFGSFQPWFLSHRNTWLRD